ncbi:MAG TPA: hypothetical protein V6D19_06645, partial [Stenomitos sp.]
EGEFLDRVGVRQVKRYRYLIKDKSVSYGLVNPSEVQGFGFVVDAYAAKKSCKKGVPCGGSCISATKKCKKTPSPTNQTKIATAKATLAQPTQPAPVAVGASIPSAKLPANQTDLDATRADLIKRVGKKQVEAAETNLQKVLDDADVFIRVGNVGTLEKILGDQFRNSFELGQDTHKIPDLADRSYLKARRRVEEETLGIDSVTPDSDRPIYGYLGTNNLNGNSHNDPSRVYGSIAVKLKPEVKDRATFTGADSFKSGYGSAIKNDGTPPPPNAASIVPATRHGYNRDNLPPHYPSYYSVKSNDDGFVRAAARAKSVDDLAPQLSLTGNSYMEAQIHGGVKPSDIAELHFSPNGVSDRPNAAIAQFAKDNKISVFVKGRQLSDGDLDAIINRSIDPVTPRLKDLRKAIGSGDYDSIVSLAKGIDEDAQKLKLAPGEFDRALKQLYAETGFDGLPRVGTEAEVTQSWQNGGHLMVRGVSRSGADGRRYLDQFQSDDYYVGNGIYGNGTYVGHASTIRRGKVTGYNAATAAQDAKRAVDDVAKHGYMGARNLNMRMVLDKDAVVVTQSSLIRERDALLNKLNAQLNAKIAATGDLRLQAEHDQVLSVLGLDTRDVGALGRFAVLQGIDFVALDRSYEPKTFGNLLNRSKILIQKDPLDWNKAKQTGAA